MTSFKNISLKILLLVTIIFCFVSVSYAEIVCVKKQVKANKKGVVNLTNSVRVESKTCPSGYKLLYTIPKGKKGDTGARGATGPKGDKGDTGATGPKGDKGDKGDNCTNGNCNTGYEDFCDSNVLESGTVITGTNDYLTYGTPLRTFCPRALMPIKQEDVLINYKNQKYQECQGSYENPTAVPGKVCVYKNDQRNSDGFYEYKSRLNGLTPSRTVVAYSYTECMEKGLNWQEAGCYDIPGRLVFVDTICSNYNDKNSCYHSSDKPSSSFLNKGYFEVGNFSDDFVCGLKFRPAVKRNQRYWTGSKCMTNFDYEITGKREEVNFDFCNNDQDCDYGDVQCYCLNDKDSISCHVGYIEQPVWDGIQCVTSLTGKKLYADPNKVSYGYEIIEEDCVKQFWNDNYEEHGFFTLTDISGEKCSSYDDCYWNDKGYCYIDKNFTSFSSPLIGYEYSWAYTAP